MNVKINGVLIASKLEEIDFSTIEVGDQILIINSNINDEIDRNISDYNMLIIEDIEANIIKLASYTLIHDIYTDDDHPNSIETDFDYKKEYIFLLLINNEILKIPEYSIIMNGADVIHDKDMNKLVSQIMTSTLPKYAYNYTLPIADDDPLTFDFIFTCPITENNEVYLGYICSNTLRDYNWRMYESYYIFNKNCICYEIKKFDIDKLLELLGKLTCTRILDDFNQFKHMHKVISYDVKDYIKDNSILKEINNFYSIIPNLSKELDKFFLPIYTNEDYKGYLSSRYERFIPPDNEVYTYDYNKYNKKTFDINRRITRTIRRYLLQYDTIVNPFTGEINDPDFINDYEDAEHLVVRKKFSNINHYHTKYNGIFVPSISEEIDEIKDLQQTLKTLCNE